MTDPTRLPDRQIKPWCADHDKILTELWPTTSASVIGTRLGRPKSSVISRAHRINLPRKASPIIRSDGESLTVRARALYESGVVDPNVLAARLAVSRKVVRRALSRAGIKLGYRQTTRPSPDVPKQGGRKWGTTGRGDTPAVPVAPKHYEYDRPAETLRAGVGGSRTACQFIPGRPAGAATLYCGAPVVQGAYCAACAAICFKVSDRPAPVTLGPLRP